MLSAVKSRRQREQVADLGSVLVGLAAVITSGATLVTALRTHKAVRTGNGTSIGETVRKIGETVNGK